MQGLEPIPTCVIDHIKENVRLNVLKIEEAKSAQQRVLIFQFDSDSDDPQRGGGGGQACPSPVLQRALESGGYCLVVRIWKGGSRWWNLNQARDVQTLAAAEMEGYRLAHRALGTKVPQLLHASQNKKESPWALLEYVGEKSTRFDGVANVYDQYWTESMIKVRDEFGFPEPHPRWGRVPVARSLPYAMRILQQVIIPLHQYLLSDRSAVDSARIRHLCGGELERESSGYTYSTMTRHYQRALQSMEDSLRNTPVNDKRLADSLKALAKCIDKLDSEPVEALPAVLVHMDCQPQNLVFARTQAEDPWCISSVLDWEDCAYADPRFELLLLGRKVSPTKNTPCGVE